MGIYWARVGPLQAALSSCNPGRAQSGPSQTQALLSTRTMGIKRKIGLLDNVLLTPKVNII